MRRILFACLALLFAFANSCFAETTIRLATIAPDGSSWMTMMRQGADQITKQTGGRVKFKFFPGGVMGNDRTVMRKVRSGQIDGGAFTSGSLSELYPDIKIYSIPFIFPSDGAVDYVRERLDGEFVKGIEDAGFACYGFAEGGFAQFFGVNPVDSTASLKGKKIWAPEGDAISYAMMESLSLSPVSLPITDVLTGLQTGLLDIVATPPIGAVAFQWNTKVHYVTTTPISYTFAMLAIKKTSLDKLSAEDQAVIREVMTKTYKEMNKKNREDNQAAYKAILKEGMKQVTPTKEVIDSWRKLSDAMAEKLISEKSFSAGMRDKVVKLVKDYQATGK